MKNSMVSICMRNENDLDCSYAIVTKQKNEIEKSVIIILKDLECIVFDYDDFKNQKNPRFLLFKQYYNEKHALMDFYKIVGKMCHKSIESKYFLNHKDEYNRIKVIDLETETMDFDYNDAELLARYNSLQQFIDETKPNMNM